MIGVAVVVGGVYRHFKGKLYRVLCVALDAESKIPLVVYEALYPSGVKSWSRPLSMWTEIVEHEGKTVPRFSLVQVDDSPA